MYNDEIKLYLKSMCQIYFWDMVEMIKIRDLGDDKVRRLDNLMRLFLVHQYVNLNPLIDKNIRYNSRLPDELDLLQHDNILGYLLINDKETLNMFLSMLEKIEVTILVMFSRDNVYIPTELHKDKHGFKRVVFLEVPYEDLPELKKSGFFTGFREPDLEYYNTLTEYREISCNNRDCKLMETDLGRLIRLAIKNKQEDKLTQNRDFIIQHDNKTLLKIFVSSKQLRDFFLSKVDDKKDYVTEIVFEQELEILTLSEISELLSFPYHKTHNAFIRRFLKFVKDYLKHDEKIDNRDFLHTFVYDIKNYLRRKWDVVKKDDILEKFPFLRKIIEPTESYCLFVLAEDVESYYKRLRKHKLKTLDIDCLLTIMEKKLKFID